MGNGRKQRAVWTCLVQGILLSLGIYLALLLLVTLLVVKGALGEDAAFPALAVSCGAAALAGGLLCARRSSWGTMPSALASALGFAAVLGRGHCDERADPAGMCRRRWSGCGIFWWKTRPPCEEKGKTPISKVVIFTKSPTSFSRRPPSGLRREGAGGWNKYGRAYSTGIQDIALPVPKSASCFNGLHNIVNITFCNNLQKERSSGKFLDKSGKLHYIKQ